ncbi:MAG: hypothetical protein QMD77_03965 [Patescibacteria group bacterium]|nr:hypothetical protein [Patescibacteria group bacterium]
MTQQESLAENGGHALCGGDVDAACELINCPHLYDHTIMTCQNSSDVQEKRQELKDDEFIIEGMSIRCGKCGTLNGHGNVPRTGEVCPKRLSLRINHLRQ